MMMMGSAYYGNGGSSSSSSSLSAAAPPFTVDRSVGKPFSPLIDFTDQSYHAVPKLNSTLQHNWLQSNSTHDFFSTSTTEFDPISSSVDYTYSPSVAHVSPSAHDDVHYSLLPPTLPEPSNPYYQPFVSSNSRSTASLNLPRQPGHELLSTTHVATPSRPSGDSFTQNVSPLDHSLQWSGMWDGLSDWQQSNQVQRDGSFDCKDSYMNQGFYAPKNIIYDEGFNGIDVKIQNHVKHADSEQKDSNSFLCKNPEFSRADYSTVVTCTSALSAPKPYSKFPYLAGGSSVGYESPLTVAIDKCSRKQGPSSTDAQLTIKLPSTVTIRPPHKDKCSLKTVNPQIGKVKVSNRDNPTTIKETGQCRKTESKPYFDATHLRFHLGKSDEEQTSNTSGTREGPSVVKPGVQVSHVYPDGFGMKVDNNNPLMSGDGFAESSDHLSSALDSPCWKGATVSQWSTFEVVRPSNIRMVEDLNGTNLLGSQISPFKTNTTDGADPQKVGEHEVGDYIRGPEGRLASFEGLGGANRFSDEGIGGPVKFQGQNAAVSCSTGVPLFGDIHGSIKQDNLHEQSVENFDEPPKKQTTEEGQGTAVKHSGFTDSSLQTKTDDLEYRPSHVPYHAVEHVLLSPPSAELSPSELTRPSNGQSAPDVYIQTLVNSMHNLSELLLFHCSSKACELREEDCETLKEVIENILSSAMNNTNGPTPLEKLATPERQNQLDALKKGPKVAMPQVSSPVTVQPLKEEDHSSLDDRKDESLPNLRSERAATEIVKHNSTMQVALKKILAENLHDEDEAQPETLLYKNLWLEAEAQLCSVNHVARYNRMKFEMEKCSSQQPNILSQNAMSMGMFPRPAVSTDIFSKGTSEFEMKSQQILDALDSDTSISSANSNPDETFARSQALKSPVIKSVAPNYSAKQDDGKEAGEANREVENSTKAEAFKQDTPFSSESSPTNDVDASVMARFQILRRRADSLNSKATDKHQPEGADLAYPFLKSPQPTCEDVSENTGVNGQVDTIMQNHSGNSMKEQLVVKEHCNLHKGNEAPTRPKSYDEGTLNTSTTYMESGLVPPLNGPNLCSTNHPPDVSARFAMLKRRAEKQGSPSSWDAEKSPSSKIPPVQNMVDIMETGVKDTQKPISLVHDHLMLGTASRISDSEALYRDQLQTLKRMVDHTSSTDPEAWPPGGTKRNWPFNVDESIGRSMGVNMESDDDAPFSEDKSDVEAFHSCARYDPVILHPMANRRGSDQSHVSWYENSSSDWEHVLKEEVAGKPC
ncbi:hypothetical protein LINPERPRIM_LOCUS7644 [Linum perenne]